MVNQLITFIHVLTHFNLTDWDSEKFQEVLITILADHIVNRSILQTVFAKNFSNYYYDIGHRIVSLSHQFATVILVQHSNSNDRVDKKRLKVPNYVTVISQFYPHKTKGPFYENRVSCVL